MMANRRRQAPRTAVISVPWTWNFGSPPDSVTEDMSVDVLARSNDWGLRRLRAGLLFIRDSWRLAGRVGEAKTVVLCTIGAEAAFVAALIRLRAGKRRVLTFDFLAPRRNFPRWLAALLLAPIDRFIVIRSGDAAMLGRRFGVNARRVTFLRWPVREELTEIETGEDGYVYAAGWAHRDWETLLEALARVDMPAILAPGRPLEVPSDMDGRVQVIEMPSPEGGRRLASRASVIAVVMKDTELPSGPLVLLDAMAMGKAVVASSVNGTRDYVMDKETALVVPPSDPLALAGALTQLGSDPGLRRRLGQQAKCTVKADYSLTEFWEGLLGQCR